MQDQHINVEIISYSYEGTTIFYQIQVKSGQKQWIVQKRYSQFEELNKVLEISFQGLPLLPKKNFITFLVGKSVEQINERKYGLQKYLQTLISRPEIFQSDVLQQFLKLKTLEQQIKNELFKENIIEEVKIVSQEQAFQIQPIPEKILIEQKQYDKEFKNSETQTSFIEVQVENIPKIETEQILIQKESDDGLSNDQQDIISEMKQQLQEYYDQLNEKELIIQNFDKKVEETQEYYNNEIFEKQRQINELQGQIGQYQESYSYLESQNSQLQQTLVQKTQELHQTNEQLSYLNSQLNEQEKIIEQQKIQIGFNERFGLIDLTQQQQMIIDQQNMIEIQMEKNNENENHLKQELEKCQFVEQQRDELFEENQLLKTQLDEEVQLRNQHIDEIEQLKLQLEYLQVQLKEKDELLEIKNELSN